mmetsp:Transcript_26645/g.79483  ORF Transcript_26645/g.79483 Transcript_26645/m.79483 type:complete len:204 (+) Transcript_26645:75-686(+)
MGGTQAQCLPDQCEERFHNTVGEASCAKLPRFDECILDQVTGLTDKECADVLLVQAVTRGEIPDVQRALENGASIDTCAELCINMGEIAPKKVVNVTPLMRAAALGHAEVIDILLEAKANPWRSDSHGWTPLCYALGAGELEVARRLLQVVGEDKEEKQKAIAQKLQKQVIEQCEETSGAERAEELKKEFDIGGFLAKVIKRV